MRHCDKKIKPRCRRRNYDVITRGGVPSPHCDLIASKSKFTAFTVPLLPTIGTLWCIALYYITETQSLAITACMVLCLSCHPKINVFPVLLNAFPSHHYTYWQRITVTVSFYSPISSEFIFSLRSVTPGDDLSHALPYIVPSDLPVFIKMASWKWRPILLKNRLTLAI